MPTYTNVGNNRALVPPSSVLTTSGAGNGFQYDNRTTYRGHVNIIAISGASASITVSIDTSYDNGLTDTWRSVGTYPAGTAVGLLARKSFPGLDRYVRASWTVSGTSPSITIEIQGEVV